MCGRVCAAAWNGVAQSVCAVCTAGEESKAQAQHAHQRAGTNERTRKAVGRGWPLSPDTGTSVTLRVRPRASMWSVERKRVRTASNSSSVTRSSLTDAPPRQIVLPCMLTRASSLLIAPVPLCRTPNRTCSSDLLNTHRFMRHGFWRLSLKATTCSSTSSTASLSTSTGIPDSGYKQESRAR